MDTKSKNPAVEGSPNLLRGILKRSGAVVFFLVLIAAILFLASGRPDWLWAWVYIGINLVAMAITGSITLHTNLEVVAERGELKITQRWDQIVSGAYLLAMYISLPLVAGLDERFGWTGDLSLGWHLAGAVALAAGLGLTSWAMIANAFFSTAVRIQSERGHTVCTSGPYQFVRHPGYVGFILQAIGLPFLLGSLWALIPGVAAAVPMIVRTSLEDRMLQAQLPGYQDYVQKVRFRLLPGVW